MFKIAVSSHNGVAFSVSVFSYVDTVQLYAELLESKFSSPEFEIEVLDPEGVYITI